MAESKGNCATGRREFLLQVAAGAAVSALGLERVAAADAPAVAAEAAMPAIMLGKERISRLVAGWNPIGGHSHTTLDMANAMREWFTTEHTVEFLTKCERQGISTWQYDHTDKSVETLRILRKNGSQLKVICLHAERVVDAPIKTVIDETAPIAMVHHGGVTDSLFRAGKAERVRDFVKKVKDHGLLAGVSSHSPDNIKHVADAGWENDFFMCCFYYVTRPAEEMQKKLGKVPVGEPFFDTDPAEMTAVMRQAGKPCLGFKILAAGRSCWSKPSVEQAFQYAFEQIKPSDGVIVGMFPRYSDQVAEDAALRASMELSANETASLLWGKFQTCRHTGCVRIPDHACRDHVDGEPIGGASFKLAATTQRPLTPAPLPRCGGEGQG